MKRLFVVGEDSPKPGDWSEWSSRVLVLASDENEAREIAGDLVDERFVAEVDMSESAFLYYELPAYAFGDR